MTYQNTSQSGFSAVELLITLFIAAAFLATGHQLYTAIVQDSGAARQKARANNLAYSYLRTQAASVPVTCAASTPLNNVVVADPPEGLTNVRVTATVSCPQAALPGLSLVTVSIRYGADAEEVSHAVYATR